MRIVVENVNACLFEAQNKDKNYNSLFNKSNFALHCKSVDKQMGSFFAIQGLFEMELCIQAV